jgi:hypothetical protein
MPNLLRLIYVSLTTVELDGPAIGALLEQAQARNEQLGMTGVLCTGRGHFVQLLEGPEDHVVSVYASILRDKRHRDVTLVSAALAAERAFPTWSMGHIDGDKVDHATHKKLVRQALVEYRVPEQAKLLQSLIKQLTKAA